MKPTLKLQDLLQQGESAIAATSTLLGHGMVSLDCTGVESLTAVQLTQLFASIPETWDFTELGEIFDPSTLTDAFAQQLLQWTNKRLGRPVEPLIPPSPSPQTLDIFNLRDEVIDDYRRYIESFLKIRDLRVEEFVDQELERGELWPAPWYNLTRLTNLAPPYQTWCSGSSPSRV